MPLVRFSGGQSDLDKALHQLLSRLCHQSLNKSPADVTAGDRNHKVVQKLPISGKSLVMYCRRMTKGEPQSIREETLDLMVNLVEGSAANSWQEWVRVHSKPPAPAKDLSSEAPPHPEDSLPVPQFATLFAGIFSGVLGGMAYLYSQDILSFDETTLAERGFGFKYAMYRISTVWTSHILGGTFSGWMLGILPVKLAKVPERSYKWWVLLIFLICVPIYMAVFQVGDRNMLFACPDHRRWGYLGNFDIRTIAMGIMCAVGLTILLELLRFDYQLFS